MTRVMTSLAHTFLASPIILCFLWNTIHFRVQVMLSIKHPTMTVIFTLWQIELHHSRMLYETVIFTLWQTELHHSRMLYHTV